MKSGVTLGRNQPRVHVREEIAKMAKVSQDPVSKVAIKITKAEL